MFISINFNFYLFILRLEFLKYLMLLLKFSSFFVWKG
nr:MAG TPA: hypothetical protein [Caudoviricetes sp.]